MLCAAISLYIWLESSVPLPALGPDGDPDPGPIPEPAPALERMGTEEEEEEEEEGGLVFLLTGGQLYIRIVPLAVPVWILVECMYGYIR